MSICDCDVIYDFKFILMLIMKGFLAGIEVIFRSEMDRIEYIPFRIEFRCFLNQKDINRFRVEIILFEVS